MSEIKIVPAHIEGASIGDTVWDKESGTEFTIRGINIKRNQISLADAEGMLWTDDPEALTTTPPKRRWKVGDKVVTPEDYESLPVRAICIDPEWFLAPVYRGADDRFYYANTTSERVTADNIHGHRVVIYLEEK